LDANNAAFHGAGARALKPLNFSHGARASQAAHNFDFLTIKVFIFVMKSAEAKK
jgi:hypothetical protein